ncbi:hypothetical protein Csa_019771 [Cucumis sativus]|nr:hypothetical protein Csa_019771 [Cucumis sativus]
MEITDQSEQETEEEIFKKKLATWLKDNNLKLTSNTNVDCDNNDRDVYDVMNIVDVGEEEHKAWITEIDSIDKLEEENNITNLHVLRRIAIRSDLNQKALREAQNWAQKCKGMCNMEGDENTTFFHKYMFNYTKKKLYN